MKASVYTHTKLYGDESPLQAFVTSQAWITLKLELQEKGESIWKYLIHLPY